MTRSRFGVRFVAPLLAALLLAPTIVRADPPTSAQARSIWRDYITDGVSSSCPGGVACYNPKKSEIRTFMGGLADAVGGLWTADKFFSPVDYGAACDGTTDDATAFASALTAAGSGGVVRIPQHKRCRVSGLSIPAGVTLKGWLERPDFNSGTNTSTSLNTMPGLLLDSTGTITLAQGATVANLYVQKTGLTFPQADPSAYAGTAFTQAADSTTIRNVLAVGFNKLVAQTGTYVSRFRIEGFYGDGINGFDISKPSYDSSLIDDFHIWPFGTQPYTTSAAMIRAGSCIKLRGAQDDTRLDRGLCLGYMKNYDLAATGSLSMGKIWGDFPNAYASGSGSIGLYLGANTANIKIETLDIYGSETGIKSEMNNTETLQVANAAIFVTAGNAIDTTGGDFVFPNLKLQTIGGIGIKIANVGTHFYARGYALGVTGAIVSVPSGGTPNFIDISLGSDPYYTPDGTAVFQGGPMSYWSVASAATINLPANGSTFNVTGTTGPIATLNGAWGGREILLSFAASPTLNESGNLNLATATYTPAAGDKIRLVYDASLSKFVEVWRGPNPARVARPAPPTASACGTSPSVDSNSNNANGKFTTGSAGTSCTLTFAASWANSPFCVVTPMAAPAAIANVPYISAQSTSAFTAAGLTASTAFNYHCGGSQ